MRRMGRRKSAIAAAVMFPALFLAFAGYWKSDAVLAVLPATGQLTKADPANGPRVGGQDGNVTITSQGGAAAAQVRSDKSLGATIVGSGHPRTKALPIADFESLEIVHPFQIEVIQADRFGVTVTADDNVLDHVKAIKDGKALKISLEEGKIYRLKGGSLKAVVRMPALARLGLSHGARGTVRGFKSNQGLNIRVSHGSTLDGEVKAGDVVVEASHGSTLQLKGKARDGRLMVAHGSTLITSDLALRAAEVDVAHGSTARVDAISTGEFKVMANHSGTVIGMVEAATVIIETGHSSKVTLKGRAQRGDITASHSSHVALGGLVLDAAKVNLEQSSSATVNAKDALDYQLENASRLKYVGQPKVGQSKSTRSSSARSISAEEAASAIPVTSREPRKPTQFAEEDMVISTINWGTGIIHIGDAGAGAITGSGNPAAKTWNVTGFDRVRVRSTFRAEITKGPEFKVTTTADDNVLPHINVSKEGTTLIISLGQGSYRLISPLKAEITLPTLVGLDIGGASKGSLKGFQSERSLALKISGASELDGGINLANAGFVVDGASKLALVGSAQAAHLSVEGASHMNLGDFVLKNAQVEVEGASTALVNIKSDGPFRASLEGASTLNGSVYASDVELVVDGASHANINGASKNAKIIIDGAGALKTPRLVIQNAQVKLSGASHATVDVKDELTYQLSSGSSLKYLGNPARLTGTKSGGSSVSRGQ